jgi:hypothetical protein
MESIDTTEINSIFKNLYTKYELDKIVSKQNTAFSEIDNLINNINQLNTCNQINSKYSNKNLKSSKYFDSKVYLSKRFYNFLIANEYFSRYGIYEEMNNRTLEQIFNSYWSNGKLKNTDPDLFSDLEKIQSLSRYERRAFVKEFINKWTSKTKDIKIEL